jgi:hypothetical protein
VGQLFFITIVRPMDGSTESRGDNLPTPETPSVLETRASHTNIRDRVRCTKSVFRALRLCVEINFLANEF